MPHLIIEHWQDVVSLKCNSCPFPPKLRDSLCCYVIEVADLFASIIWLIGSICFIPAYDYLEDAGCLLFVIGSGVFAGVCTFTYLEAVARSGLSSFEAWENALYFFGSIMFLLGTTCYWLMPYEFFGTLLFISASFFYGFAAFCNGLNLQLFETITHQLLVATTSLYMCGSMMFIMGSVCFMPEMGNNNQMNNTAAASFILGSVLYVAGSIVSLIRTMMERGAPDASHLISIDSQKESGMDVRK